LADQQLGFRHDQRLDAGTDYNEDYAQWRAGKESLERMHRVSQSQAKYALSIMQKYETHKLAFLSHPLTKQYKAELSVDPELELIHSYRPVKDLLAATTDAEMHESTKRQPAEEPKQ